MIHTYWESNAACVVQWKSNAGYADVQWKSNDACVVQWWSNAGYADVHWKSNAACVVQWWSNADYAVVQWLKNKRRLLSFQIQIFLLFFFKPGLDALTRWCDVLALIRITSMFRG